MESARQYREALDQRAGILSVHERQIHEQVQLLGLAGKWGAALSADGLEAALGRILRTHGHQLDEAGRERLRDLLR
jgi:hypothetical protein